MSKNGHSGWIGVDLDGTLAHYDGWVSIDHIGEPITPMVERVKRWLERGETVKIFTARVHGHGAIIIGGGTADVITPIEQWCLKHLGQVLPITNVKDFGMLALYDDRAVQVVPNTGHPIKATLETVVFHLRRGDHNDELMGRSCTNQMIDRIEAVLKQCS